jgi:hypothetical protein
VFLMLLPVQHDALLGITANYIDVTKICMKTLVAISQLDRRTVISNLILLTLLK